MRVIICKERPHPGAQLRITDRDGPRLTAFVTNTPRGQLADLELRHRRRARCEDRIRTVKDTGLANPALHGFDQNRIWCAIVQLACGLTAWLQMLALHDDPARRWEPKRLRLRLFSIAGRVAHVAFLSRNPTFMGYPSLFLAAKTTFPSGPLVRLEPGHRTRGSKFSCRAGVKIHVPLTPATFPVVSR